MTLGEFVILLIIAAVCGSIGQSLVRYSVGGFMVSIGVGLLGAYIGQWIAREFGLPTLFAVNIGGNSFPIVWSIIGSAIFAIIVSLINKNN